LRSGWGSGYQAALRLTSIGMRWTPTMPFFGLKISSEP
jgi:hypothetical protein